MDISQKCRGALARPTRSVTYAGASARGVIDLASIMVGGIITGIVAVGVAVTVFGVIPWTQDNAAKQDLAAVQTAESTYHALNSTWGDLADLTGPGIVNAAGGAGGGVTASVGASHNGPLLAGVGENITIWANDNGYLAKAVSETGREFWVTQSTAGATDAVPDTLPDNIYDPTSPIMVSTWDTTLIEGTELGLPLHGDIDATIDWGDGTESEATEGVSHTYDKDGKYTVAIHGTFEGWGGTASWNPYAITSVEQWSKTETTDLSRGMQFAQNLVSLREVPRGVTNMRSMFTTVINFNGDLSGWDVSQVTDMSFMFSRAENTSPDLSGWDTSSVEDMTSMFYRAFDFNSDISDWDVSSVQNMTDMFSYDLKFDQDLPDWDVRSLEDATRMFKGAEDFNGDLTNWNLESAILVVDMFSGADSFNGDVSGWDVSHMTSLWRLFFNATAFNRDISDWDTSNVENFAGIFEGAESFDQNISGWDTGNATTMADTFWGAESFNQDLSGWDVSNVTGHDSFASDSYLPEEYWPNFP